MKTEKKPATGSSAITPDEALKAGFESLLHGGVFDPRTGKVTPLPANMIPLAKYVPISSGITQAPFDLANASARMFLEYLEKFNADTLAMGQLPPLNIANGWYQVGPAFAEYLLRHNRPNANREPSISTVRYYQRQMERKQWQPTGESLILTYEDIQNNGQHRNFSSLLGKTSFVTYIVADAPPVPNAFAFIDNVKVRTSSTALKTAGLNGTASLAAALVTMAVNFEEGAYTCQKKRRTDRLSPIDVLNFVGEHPLVRRAAHLAAGEYKAACEKVGHKDVVAFVVYRLLSDFGEDTCDRFMEEIEFDNPNASDTDAGHALRVFLVKQQRSNDPLAKHLVLAHIIKAFNAWIQELPLRSVKIATDDDFPTFVEPTEVAFEAESEAATA